ncbi:MAG: hypothetical protein H8D46_03825 [FCB group bacterium]|nr:hypothetical protein [FCB group bacterium]
MAKIDLGKIIPRWEWRTFGESFGTAETNIGKYECTRVKESSEVYIISKMGGNNTKIRDMLMDIKLLETINTDKLEQWMPVMKSSFPVATEDISEVFKAANIKTPDYKREKYTYDQFLDELINNHPDLKAVGVFKKRYGYMIDEAIVEIADLQINGTSIKTAAVEHENPQLVIDTVRKLELDQFENINYITGIKQVVGW